MSSPQGLTICFFVLKKNNPSNTSGIKKWGDIIVQRNLQFSLIFHFRSWIRIKTDFKMWKNDLSVLKPQNQKKILCDYMKIVSIVSPIIMEMENHPKWKETNIGGTHFPLPWLREEGYPTATLNGMISISCLHILSGQSSKTQRIHGGRDSKIGLINRAFAKYIKVCNSFFKHTFNINTICIRCMINYLYLSIRRMCLCS